MYQLFNIILMFVLALSFIWIIQLFHLISVHNFPSVDDTDHHYSQQCP